MNELVTKANRALTHAIDWMLSSVLSIKLIKQTRDLIYLSNHKLMIGIGRYQVDHVPMWNPESWKLLPVESEIRLWESKIPLKIRIRNPGPWNPEYTCGNQESH